MTLIRKFCLGLAALLLTATVMADAALDRAKAEGLVGEDASGYLAAVSSRPSTQVRDLVENINSRRRQTYEQIAARNNIDVAAVEQLAGKKAIEKTRPGHYIRLPGSSWQQK